MEDKKITCPNCGNEFYYWTINDFITCQGCKTKINIDNQDNKK